MIVIIKTHDRDLFTGVLMESAYAIRKNPVNISWLIRNSPSSYGLLIIPKERVMTTSMDLMSLMSQQTGRAGFSIVLTLDSLSKKKQMWTTSVNCVP